MAIALGLVALYGLVDPASGYYPRCMFKQLTGLDCPGCGSQRAIHAILHGNLAEAWSSNAMLFILVPLLMVLTLAILLRQRFPRLYLILNSRSSSLLVLLHLVIWTIYRNLPI